MQKPLILVTNDDGIEAEGIKFLTESLGNSADIVIVAPSHEQSATSLSITLRTPLQYKKRAFGNFEAYSVNGTPADSVKMALSVILKRKPSLIVSGINCGSNSGRNVLYSGTVSAVIEGALRGIPGIAFSCWDMQKPNYSLAAEHIPSIVKYVFEHPLDNGILLNVNFPSHKAPPFKGIKMTRQGWQYWLENPQERSHPHGESYYWLGSRLSEIEDHDESDTYWLNKGFATAVPVNVGELTHHETLKRKSHFESFFLTS